MRRRPADPGIRPRGRFCAGRCRGCGAPYVIDRAVQPWARARTCSEHCAKVLANRDRRPGSCRHCDMVRDYHLVIDAQLRRIEVAARDENARLTTFREWLIRFEWEPRELAA